MMRRPMAILAAAVLVFLLAACGGGKTDTMPETEDPSVTAADTVAESEETKSAEETEEDITTADAAVDVTTADPTAADTTAADETTSDSTAADTTAAAAGPDLSYAGAAVLNSSVNESGKAYVSTAPDESALLIDTTGAVSVSDFTAEKNGDSGGDGCSDFGLNAAVLLKGGGIAQITDGTVTSSAEGANGIFCYGGGGNDSAGDGTTLTVRNVSIQTSGSASCGIMTNGGGIMYAEDLIIATSGAASAAIRAGGGGIVYVSGGSYTANGPGSPAIYSAAKVCVSNAVLVSDLSEGVCIEGGNSAELVGCDLTANNTGGGKAAFLSSVMLCQPLPGDADSGTASFSMMGGTLTSKSGHVFHVTNTDAVISLSGAEILNEDSGNVLLSVCDDSLMGGAGSAVLNAEKQTLEGAILVGDNSSLRLNLTAGSRFTGYITGSIRNASGTVISEKAGSVSVTLDDDSRWTLTADSYVTSFSGNAANVSANGYTLYVNGTALSGTK